MLESLPLVAMEQPLSVQIHPTRSVSIRMKDLSGSVAIALDAGVTHVSELIERFHTLAFAKAYTSYIDKAALLRMAVNSKTGLVQETPVASLDELNDMEVLVYRPCEELRKLVEQGCITPVLGARTRVSPPAILDSPSLKRKGRATSVTSNVERVHRYGSMLAKMDLSPREKELIEDKLIVGDEQVVDAMEQFTIHRNEASVRRVLHGPSAALETLSLDFSSLDVHSPAVPSGSANLMLQGENPFIAAATSFYDISEDPSMMEMFSFPSQPVESDVDVRPTTTTSSSSRPSLMFDDDSLSTPSVPLFLSSIKEKTTPPSRMSLSLDDLDTTYDELMPPQLFSIAALLENVPVGSDFQDKYTISNVLGSGKYSVVKLCTNKASGVTYAVKIIDKRQTMEIRFLKRELEIMYGLRHDGIVQLMELFETNEELFLVMELCKQELFEYIDRQGSLEEEPAQRLIRRLVETVAYLHDQCIVHRDIKPENILIYGHDVSDIKLTDFGIARKLEGGQGNGTLTPHESLSEVANLHDNTSSAALSASAVRNRLARAHTKCGTRDYVAPEVMSGKGYGTEADLWSVGVVTYVLLSGCAPVFLPTSDGTRKVFFSDDMWTAISDDCKSFIESLLVRNPEERTTAAEALQHNWLKPKSDV